MPKYDINTMPRTVGVSRDRSVLGDLRITEPRKYRSTATTGLGASDIGSQHPRSSGFASQQTKEQSSENPLAEIIIATLILLGIGVVSAKIFEIVASSFTNNNPSLTPVEKQILASA